MARKTTIMLPAPSIFPGPQPSSRSLRCKIDLIASCRPCFSGEPNDLHAGNCPDGQRTEKMANIGFLTRKQDGSYHGKISTLTLDAPIVMTPIDRVSERAPDFRVTSGEAEVGAGWIRTNKITDAPYITITLDTPELPRRIHANLGQAPGQNDPNVFVLIWNRPGTLR